MVAASQIDESGSNKPNIVCHVFNDEFSVARYRRSNYSLKGHSQLWERADLDTTFASLKSVYLNPKSNVRVGYIAIRFNLA